MFKIIKNFIKNKKSVLLIFIDILFYLYLFFGMISLFMYGLYNNIEPSTIAIIYIVALIPIFILKAYRDNINYNFKRIFFNEK